MYHINSYHHIGDSGTFCHCLLRILTKEVIEDLKNSADMMIESDAWNIVSDPDHADMREIPKRIRITLVGPDGQAIQTIMQMLRIWENHKNRPEIKAAFADGEGKAVRNSQTMGKSAFYYAVRLDNGDVLRISRK